jgi:nucleotide-binding universal stress UspA family protein
MFERIAIPLDGSELGELALPWATEIASIFNSEVSVISVSDNESIEERRMRETYLEHKVENINNQLLKLNTKVNMFVLVGEPATKIVEYTQQQKINLLILVSHGRSGIMPWPMGSTASRILSRVNCHVLFIRARKVTSQQPSLLQHVLVALDGSNKSEEVIPYLAELAARVSVRVTLFQVISPEREVVTIGGMNTVQIPRMQLDRLTREANDYLRNNETKFPTGRVESIVRTGSPAHEILQFAESNNINLIGITTRGQSETGEWQFGQVAHKLIHSSILPVLLVKTGANK